MKRSPVVLALCFLLAGRPAFAADPHLKGAPDENTAVRIATAQKVIDGENCRNCDLFQVDFSYKDLSGRDLSGARLRQTDFSVVTGDKAKFKGANLSIINAYGARFENADFSGADLSEATLVGAYFGGANFTRAKLSKANLSGSDLATAKGLTQAQLDEACGDASSGLPKGLHLKRCKSVG